jgi:hypothetical protein
METTEDLRRFFMETVIRGIASELSEGDDPKIKVRDALLRIKDVETRGLLFSFESYRANMLREAEINENECQPLGLVLEEYVQFQYCLLLLRGSSKLRVLFKKNQLQHWLGIKSDIRPFQYHVLHYFQLMEEWIGDDNSITQEDINRLQTLSNIFDVRLTFKLRSLIAFFDWIPQTVPAWEDGVSEYER